MNASGFLSDTTSQKGCVRPRLLSEHEPMWTRIFCSAAAAAGEAKNGDTSSDFERRCILN